MNAQKVRFYNISPVKKMIPNRDMLNLGKAFLEFSKSIVLKLFFLSRSGAFE